MRKYAPQKAKPVPQQATRVFKGIIYDVYQWQQETFDGKSKTYEMLKRPDTVRVITIIDNKICIVKQEQLYIGSFIDIPGGMADHAEEDELQAAKRELLEETGLTCDTWKLIDAVQTHNKIDQINYLFLAYNSDPAKNKDSLGIQRLDAGEERIEVQFLTLEEVKLLFDNPEVRFLPKEILSRIHSVEELKNIKTLYEY